MLLRGTLTRYNAYLPIVVTFVACMPTATLAQNANPDARAALASMRFYVGDWQCRGFVAATSAPISFRSTVTLGQGGLTFRTLAASSDRGSGLHEVTSGDVLWRYDTDARRWMSEQSDGGPLESVTSSGWVGSDLTWTGYLRSRGRRTVYRNTLRKIGDAEVRSLSEAADAAGAFKPLGVTVCKKARVSVGSR